MNKKILLIGGTGTMGDYLSEMLLKMGYKVDIITVDFRVDKENLKHYFIDAMDDQKLSEILENKYDAIVDFLYYTSSKFISRMDLLLSNTNHYIAFSSYRVYAESKERLTEQSPRLLETVKDKEFLESDDYAQAKCRIEDAIRASSYKNWTILRPTIVYGHTRRPLVNWTDNQIFCAEMKRQIVLPKDAMKKKITLIWGKDAANMISKLIFNPKAFMETFIVGTAETITWQDVLDCYTETIGLEAVFTDTETVIDIQAGKENKERRNATRWALQYDRLIDRSIDNSKILEATGIKQCELAPIKEGLKTEIIKRWAHRNQTYARMVDYIENIKNK